MIKMMNESNRWIGTELEREREKKKEKRVIMNILECFLFGSASIINIIIHIFDEYFTF